MKARCPWDGLQTEGRKEGEGSSRDESSGNDERRIGRGQEGLVCQADPKRQQSSNVTRSFYSAPSPYRVTSDRRLRCPHGLVVPCQFSVVVVLNSPLVVHPTCSSQQCLGDSLLGVSLILTKFGVFC